MQEEITTELIERATTTYSCDQEGCDFTTEDKSEAKRHYGKVHAVKERATVSELDLYRFESKEDLDAYLKAQKSTDYVDDPSWEGPGWYRVFIEWEPCGRGCCEKDHLRNEPASWIGFEWRREIEEMTKKAYALEAFVEEHDDGY